MRTIGPEHNKLALTLFPVPVALEHGLTKLLVHLLYLKNVFSSIPILVVELVPSGHGSHLPPRKLGQGVKA